MSACVTPYQSGDTRRAPVVDNRSVEDASPTPPPVGDEGDAAEPLLDEPSISAEPLVPETNESPVVESLLAAADQQKSVGELDSAAVSLERALRIEPRNAMLWGKLAEVRFEQQQWQQAIQMAAKSNILAGDNHSLRRRNWYLMANAYHAVGDAESAQKYRDMISASTG